MKFIAIEREVKSISTSHTANIYKSEAEHIYSLYEKDIVREIFFTEENCAVIIMECDTIDNVRQIISTLPLVQAGMIEFEIHSLLPYRGFRRLFESDN